jgi:hypothetical protein
MIKGNEIRIGNVVKQGGELFMITRDTLQTEDFWNDLLAGKIEGVELKADVLLKIGFKKRTMEGSGYPIFWYSVPLYRPLSPHGSGKSFQLQGMIDDEKFTVPVQFTMESFAASREVRHLHDLQNLYFSLMGEEMQVKL